MPMLLGGRFQDLILGKGQAITQHHVVGVRAVPGVGENAVVVEVLEHAQQLRIGAFEGVAEFFVGQAAEGVVRAFRGLDGEPLLLSPEATVRFIPKAFRALAPKPPAAEDSL